MDEKIEAIVDFWSTQWVRDASRDAFRAALRCRLEAMLSARPDCNHYLEVDYDPDGALLDATNDAGVPCAGMMFSADGIFANRKTRMTIYPDRVEVGVGYGAVRREWWPKRAADATQHSGRF